MWETGKREAAGARAQSGGQGLDGLRILGAPPATWPFPWWVLLIGLFLLLCHKGGSLASPESPQAQLEDHGGTAGEAEVQGGGAQCRGNDADAPPVPRGHRRDPQRGVFSLKLSPS